MKLTIVQKDINNSNYSAYLENLSDSDSDLVCFGELGTTGCLYDGGNPVDQDELAKSFEQYQFATMIGFPRNNNGQLCNSYLFHHRGKSHTYDKINLFEPMNEPDVYQPGENVGLFDTELGNFGVAICYDIRFPELFTTMKDNGAEIIFIPAAFPRVRIRVWRELLVERAVQTGLPVVGINSVGDDGTNEFGGSSMVINGDGEVLALADEINETIIEVEL